MRFLIDAQLPPRLRDRLGEAGHTAFHVFEMLPADATDVDVASAANRLGAVLISKDEDFLELSRRGLLISPLIWIRTGNMTTSRLWLMLEPLLPSIEQALAMGESIIEVR